jgi:hypothetical protein
LQIPGEAACAGNSSPKIILFWGIYEWPTCDFWLTTTFPSQRLSSLLASSIDSLKRYIIPGAFRERLNSAATRIWSTRLAATSCPATYQIGVQKMSENEVRSPAMKTPFVFGVKVLIAAVVIGFGVLHFARDAMLHHSATKAASAKLIDYGDWTWSSLAGRTKLMAWRPRNRTHAWFARRVNLSQPALLIAPPNQMQNPPVSSHMRGVSRSSRTRDGMRWTLAARLTKALIADGEVVWSWRLDAGVKFLRSKLLRGDGDKKARSPGRARNKP